VAAVPRTRPGQARIGTASAGRGTALVRWAAPTSTGGATITSYVVRAYRGAALVRAVTVRGTVRAVTLGGLRPGSTHRFTVTAVNAAGAGPVSRLSNGVRPRR
jgi:hypothetical protein